MAFMPKKNNIFYLLSFASQLGLIIAIPLVGFFLLGVFLDKKLGTLPWLSLLFSILGFVFVVFEVRSYIVPILKETKRQ